MHGPQTRAESRIRPYRKWQMPALLLLSIIVPLHLRGAEDPSSPPSTQFIVQKLQQANARRADALRCYQGKRAYTLNYQGFPGARSASMAVEATYTAPDKKRFDVVNQDGSKMLLNRVLLKLLDSEKEALQEPNKLATELNPRNYDFAYLQMDNTAYGPAYVLQVTPRTNTKFLYKGKIWVDAADFAVVRIDGEPGKNPSFWINHTRIDQRYGKFGDFWLPVHNQSVTHSRFGGDAVLNIEYTDYHINAVTKDARVHPIPSPTAH
jgi:hypothetical protein